MKSEHETVLCNLSTQSTDILQRWQGLTDVEKEMLLPHLLTNVQEWQSIARSDVFLAGWIRRRFAAAGLSLRR